MAIPGALVMGQSFEDAIAKLQSVTFESPETTDYESNQSHGFGRAAGIRGTMHIKDGSQTLATLTFSSNNRQMSHATGQLVLPSGATVAEATRETRSSIGSKFTFQRYDQSGGLQLSAPFCQPSCKWVVCAFACFIPTVGLGACYALSQISKTPHVINVNSMDGSTGYPALEIRKKGDSVISFGSLDSQGKLDLILTAICTVLEIHCAPPPNHNAGGGGGGM
mmetsp:Transcript_15957/g.32774  ORF Transcript_15957/g.32774 Transcript_15957/m.32774 type:complete len:222 (-) Transcript_15957:95-760(-)